MLIKISTAHPLNEGNKKGEKEWKPETECSVWTQRAEIVGAAGGRMVGDVGVERSSLLPTTVHR